MPPLSARRAFRACATISLFVVVFAASLPAAPTPDLWKGSVSGTWNTSSSNWMLKNGLGAFVTGDSVEFDDGFTGTTNITVQSLGVTPSTVTFAHTGTTATNYVFTSSGTVGIGGTTTSVALASGFVGSVDFNLTNTYGGGTTIDGGTLIVHSVASLGATTGGLTLNAGTLEVANGFSTSRSITLGSTSSTIQVDASQTYTVTSAIGGTGVLNKTGSGTLVLSVANSYTGGTVINGGTLSVVTNALGNGALTINSGTLEVAATISTTRTISLGSSSSAINVDNGLTYTVSNGMTGSGALNVTGTGTVALAGANTYSGGTTISSGTLQLNASERLLDTGALTVSGGTLNLQTFNETVAGMTLTSGTISGSGTLTGSSYNVQSGTVAAVLGGTAALTKTTSGSVTLSAANTYTGGTTINAGTVIANSASSLGASSGALTLNAGTLEVATGYNAARNITLGSSSSTIQIDSAQTLNSTGVLSGSGALNKTGAGTLELGNSNTFTGATNVNSGTVQVDADGALGTTGSGTTIASGAALRLNSVNYSTAESLTLNGSGVANGGALVNVGTSTFAGAISAATDATISAGGGTLNLTGGLAKNGTTLTLTGGGRINISGNGISGSLAHSDLVVDGTTVTLSAASTYNGPTTIQNSGTLQLGASNVLPSSPQTAMTVNTSSALDMASYSDGVASLTGDSTAIVKNSVAGTTSTLTVNPDSGTSTTFAGVIAGTNSGAQGDMALVKSGAGTVVLGGANTFSGSTTVNAGTLTVAANAGSALGATSSVTVNSGGTLLLGASNQINNTAGVTLAGGTFAKGDYSEGGTSSAGVGALTLNASGSHLDFGTGTVGTLTFASFTPNAYSIVIDNWTGTANAQGSPSSDRLIFATDQTANLNYFAFGGYAAGATEFALGNGYYEVVPTAVPEPGTYAAAVLSGSAIIVRLVRRPRRVHTLEA